MQPINNPYDSADMNRELLDERDEGSLTVVNESIVVLFMVDAVV